MDEEKYLNWVLKDTRHGSRDKKNTNRVKRKLMVYRLVPRGIDINANEPLGMEPESTVGISYIISGILFSHALSLFM